MKRETKDIITKLLMEQLSTVTEYESRLEIFKAWKDYRDEQLKDNY